MKHYPHHIGDFDKAKASAEAKRLKKLQALNGDSTAVEQPLNSVEAEAQRNSTNQSTINQSTNKPIEPIGSLPPYPHGLDVQAWDRWVAYRKDLKKPIKTTSVESAQNALAKHGHNQAAVVDQSIANGWQGLFDLKQGVAPSLSETTYQRSMRLRIAEVSPSLARQAPGESQNPVEFFQTIDAPVRVIRDSEVPHEPASRLG